MPGKTAPKLSTLEQLQQHNRDANRLVLRELGLLEPLPPLRSAFRVQKRAAPPAKPRPSKRPLCVEDGVDRGSVVTEGRRRSTRTSVKPKLQHFGLDDSDYEPDSDDADSEEEEGARKKRNRYVPRIKVAVPKNREKAYGAIEGVPVGTWWRTRLECCSDGVHRPTVAGIHAGADGAYSIALSGGYEDDVDWGECFTYTGEGGRDLKGTAAKPKNLRTAPQSQDQQLTRGNLALSRNVETRTPVRVIRGYKLPGPYAPESGYRYDGLYWVEKYWMCSGLAGFLVYKYALRRCEQQASPPWKDGPDVESDGGQKGASQETEDETTEGGPEAAVTGRVRKEG